MREWYYGLPFEVVMLRTAVCKVGDISLPHWRIDAMNCILGMALLFGYCYKLEGVFISAVCGRANNLNLTRSPQEQFGGKCNKLCIGRA